MATLTPAQIAEVASKAGFKGGSLEIAVAVALGESSGRTDAKNPNSSAIGLWQIMQRVHVRDHPTWTNAYLLDPQNNARAAYTLSNGGVNWRPWVVYTNGTYRAHLGQARHGIAGMGQADLGGSDYEKRDETRPTGDWTNILNFVEALGKPETWARIGFVVVGAVMVIIALLRFSGIEKVGKAAVNTAVAGYTRGVVRKVV